MNTTTKTLLLAAIMIVAVSAAAMVYADESDADNLSIDVQYMEDAEQGRYGIVVQTSIPMNSADITIVADGVTVFDKTCSDPSNSGKFACVLSGPIAEDSYTVTVVTSQGTATYPADTPVEPTEYTVTFVYDDDVTADSTVQVEEGQPVAAPAEPTREGYTFAGWYNGDVEYDFTAPVTGNITLTAHWTLNEEPVEPTTYTVTITQVENATIEVTDAEGNPVMSGASVDAGSVLNVIVTPAEGYEVVGESSYEVTVNADTNITAEIKAIGSEEPTEDPADRPFPNTITLSDGAVIDASSSITASSTQEIVIAGDVTVAAGGFLDISGKLTIQDGAALTIEQDGNVYIQKDGIVDVQGDLIAEAGAEEATFQYGGCLMTVAGSVTLEGANSFQTNADAKGITVSGLFEVGDEATAVLDGATIAQGGELLVYGIVENSTIVNQGTITVDSQGLEDGTSVDMDVQIGADAVVEITNVFGTVTVSDSDLTFTEKKEQVPAKYDNTVTLVNVAGVTVTETMTIQQNEDKVNEGVNTMLVAGGANVADDYNSSTGIAGTVTVAGGNVEIADTASVGQDVILDIQGDLTVSGELTAIDGKIKGTSGSLTVTGKVTSADQINGITVNSAEYRTAAPNVYYVYTTLETAINTDGATDIDLRGENTVAGDLTIAVGTTVDMTDGSKLTVGKDATLTVSSDDRKSGKLNTATKAVDTIDVQGTMVADNFAKSGIKADAVLSDTSKAVEDSMTYTNVYNALENAADGETVEISRSNSTTVIPVILDKDVGIDVGVTLLVPNNQKVQVDNGVTVTVDGTVRLTGTGAYEIAAEIPDDEATPENEAEPAGATVVNGMFLYVADYDYTAQIVGAYFDYTVDRTAYNAIAPLASVPAIAGDIGSDVCLYGAMDIGAVDFSAYDGDGVFNTILAYNDLTIESLTLGVVEFDARNAVSVTGEVILANGSVVLDGVKGITAENSTDADDVTTSVIGGTADVVQDEENTVDETGTVSVTGEIVSSMGTTQYVAVDVPADATLRMTGGALAGDVSVEGTAVVAGTSVTFATLTVTGTVSADGSNVATAVRLFVGVTAEDYAMAGTGDVSGVTLAAIAESVAYVSPNATIAEEITDGLKTTAYMVEDSLYLTAYANQNNTVGVSIPFAVDNARFDGWQYIDSNDRLQPVAADAVVGTYDEVYADIEYAIYNVKITADAGIGTVAVDGVVLTNMGGNVFETAPLTAGQHTISYTLKSGYEGEATLTVNGQAVSGMTFELSGNPEAGADFVDVQLSLAGTTPSDSTVVIDNGGSDELGLTDYLLIILVILIVIMAIIVALRLMRS